jgi:hypothetical protein
LNCSFGQELRNQCCVIPDILLVFSLWHWEPARLARRLTLRQPVRTEQLRRKTARHLIGQHWISHQLGQAASASVRELTQLVQPDLKLRPRLQAQILSSLKAGRSGRTRIAACADILKSALKTVTIRIS